MSKKRIINKQIKYKTKKIANWKTISIGTVILVSGGPYYGQEGKRRSLGFKGICKVKAVLPDGLLGLVENTTQFIYMGPKTTGIVGVKVPHKIVELIYD